jgi:hypothetical protein
LNESQKPRWDYFFRPNMKLINDIDKQRLHELTTYLNAATIEQNALGEVTRIFRELDIVKSRDRIFIVIASLCTAGALLFWAVFNSPWRWTFVLLSLVGALVAFGVRPYRQIHSLEQAKQQHMVHFGENMDSPSDVSAKQQAITARITTVRDEIAAIMRFRDDLLRQRPARLNDSDMDSLLDGGLHHLIEREQRRLNIHDEEDAEVFPPIVRWALETDRKDVLDVLRPPVYSIARQKKHYVRYEIQIIFVHRGRLTLYEGFYDLIQGEFMGETRRHIILANLFSVDDETTENFDFRRRIEDAISLSYQHGDGMDTEADEVDDTAQAVSDAAARRHEADPELVSLTQTTIVRFVGVGNPIELKFVVSGQRDSLIAQLQRKQELVEAQIAKQEEGANESSDDRDADSGEDPRAYEEQLIRFQEYEERVRRSTTTHDVERIISRILEHTGRAVRDRQTAPHP